MPIKISLSKTSSKSIEALTTINNLYRLRLRKSSLTLLVSRLIIVIIILALLLN